MILHISQQDESSMKLLPKQVTIKKKFTLQYSATESRIIEQHCVSYRDCTVPNETNYVRRGKKVFLAYVPPHSHRKTNTLIQYFLLHLFELPTHAHC